MALCYDTKRRNAAPRTRSEVPQDAEQKFNAMQNVDIHSGRRLDLEASLKSRIEKNTGFRMDNVELRESSDAAAMDAKAFAKGNVVHFAPGQFRPDTEVGQHLIEHELTHVAQQARGGVKADVEGLNVNASEHLENQADSGMGHSGGALQALPTMNAEAAPIQGLFGGIKKFFKKHFGKSKEEAVTAPAAPAARQLDEVDSMHDETIDAEIAKQRGMGTSEKDIKEMRRYYGYGLKTRENFNFAEQAIARSEAENAEMAEFMRQNGFSEEEIRAQTVLQNYNRSNRLRSNYDDRKMGLNFSKFGELGVRHQLKSEDASKFLNMGWGVNSEEEKQALRAKEDRFFDYVGRNNDQDQAEQAAMQLRNSTTQGRAEDALNAIAQHKQEKSKHYHAAQKRYQDNHGLGDNYDWSASDKHTYELRLLQRILTGDQNSDDAAFDAMLSDDPQRKLPYIKEIMNQAYYDVDPEKIGEGTSDNDFLSNAVSQITKGQDVMPVSDMLKKGKYKEYGISDQEYEDFMKVASPIGLSIGKASVRLKKMSGNTSSFYQ